MKGCPFQFEKMNKIIIVLGIAAVGGAIAYGYYSPYARQQDAQVDAWAAEQATTTTTIAEHPRNYVQLEALKGRLDPATAERLIQDPDRRISDDLYVRAITSGQEE
jgi:uncharacterized membrane protein YebE (DUF533 family)